ncbi:hypothetical protein AHAS_Ahas14G0258200 [Arachis hypogaea]
MIDRNSSQIVPCGRNCNSTFQQKILLETASEDNSFSCFTQEDDANGKVDALKTNITTLGPLVLPTSEKLLFFATLVVKNLLKLKVKAYIPDFKLAFEHFCIHTGGKAVLDELEKNL